ncbi:MAG: OmpA family protein [Spirochaetes bacterium]|jgi:outer membrane protein OmpA-like peptidoglycan-associated protein|nr:OmpA family protein [Spirochaetota bacterium]
MRDVRLGVEIDNSRIVEVTPLAYGASGTMDLAAIERGQRRALVRLYVLRGTKRTELTTMDVRNLPAFPNRRALLRLRSTVDHAGELRLRLDVEDRLYHDERVDVRPYIRRSRTAVAAAALGLILLLAAVAFLVFGGLPGGETTAPVAETPVSEETAREETAPDETTTDETAPREEPAAEAAAEGRQTPPAGETGTDDAAPAGAAAEDDAATEEADGRAEAEPEPVSPQAVEPAEWSVYFTPDSPVLTARARTRLSDIAERLEDYPAEVTVRITGHTALAGTERGRYDLSEQRARNVYRYLQTAGWDPGGEVDIRGIGGEAPVTRDRERQELNRRVEIEAGL